MEKKPWGVILGILGGGVPPRSLNSDLFQTKKYGYSHPFSDLPCKKIMSPLLRLELQQKRFVKIHFKFAYFSFFLGHLELK